MYLIVTHLSAKKMYICLVNQLILMLKNIASKLQDIAKHTQEITDARVVIIHTGMNNLRI